MVGFWYFQLRNLSCKREPTRLSEFPCQRYLWLRRKRVRRLHCSDELAVSSSSHLAVRARCTIYWFWSKKECSNASKCCFLPSPWKKLAPKRLITIELVVQFGIGWVIFAWKAPSLTKIYYVLKDAKFQAMVDCIKVVSFF